VILLVLLVLSLVWLIIWIVEGCLVGDGLEDRFLLKERGVCVDCWVC
jgi:hypothetical protein